MKFITTTKVTRISEDGEQQYYCHFVNEFSLDIHLAHLLASMTSGNFWPYRCADGSIVDPVQEARKEIVITAYNEYGFPLRGYFEHKGVVYFGQVEERKIIDEEN